MYQSGRRSLAERQGGRRSAVSAVREQRDQLDRNSIPVGSDTELAVFITLATFRNHPISAIIIPSQGAH